MNVKINRLNEQEKELKDLLGDREKIKMKVMTLCHQAFCVVVLILMGLEFTGVITIPFWLFNGLVAVLLISTIIVWIDQRKKKEESIGQ